MTTMPGYRKLILLAVLAAVVTANAEDSSLNSDGSPEISAHDPGPDNAQLRNTVRKYKSQIADMEKKFGAF